MCKLFVLGNGFDIKHKLPTSYNNFKNFPYFLNYLNLNMYMQYIHI